MSSSLLKSAYKIALAGFPNEELAALNNAIQMGSQVPKQNIAHARAVEASLIKESGSPHDLEALRDAAASEVNKRSAAGKFN